jgi:hypothetical protein
MTWMIAGILVYLLYWCGPVVSSITYGSLFFVWLVVMAILWKLGVPEFAFILFVGAFDASTMMIKAIFQLLVS